MTATLRDTEKNGRAHLPTTDRTKSSVGSVSTFLTLGEKNLTCTVFLILCEGPGYSGEYRSVRKSELISVDFPRPDSPESQRARVNGRKRMHFTLLLFFLILSFEPDRSVTWHNLQRFIATASYAACACLTFFTWFRSEHVSVQEIALFNLFLSFSFFFLLKKITRKCWMQRQTVLPNIFPVCMSGV